MQRVLHSYRLISNVAAIVIQWRIGVPGRVLARQTRHRMEQLGPVFIKMGQMLACRPDIVPPEVIEEFQPLLTAVHPVPYSEVAPFVPEGVVIDLEPLATGSIAQVHLGKLSDARVIVKIKKPGLNEDVHRDLETVRNIIHQGAKTVGALKDVDMFLDQFEIMLRNELDFVREVDNMIEYSNKNNPLIKVPRVYRRMCNEHAIVMEFCPSNSATEFKERVPAIQASNVANVLMHAYMYRLLMLGSFHADPHPGNVGFLDDGRVVMYDFGAVMTFDKRMRSFLRDTCMHMITGDSNALLADMLQRKVILPIGEQSFDTSSLADIKVYIDAMFRYITDTDLRNITMSLQTVAGKNGRAPFVFAPQFVLMLRAIAMLEGTCKILDPNFSYVASLMALFVTDAGSELLKLKAQKDAERLLGTIVPSGLFDLEI